MFGKQIVKYIEDGEVVDGEVVNEGRESESGSFASRAWAWFFSSGHNQTVGGNEWESTAEANGNTNPTQCSYEALQDNQGSVPCWDGYNGE